MIRILNKSRQPARRCPAQDGKPCPYASSCPMLICSRELRSHRLGLDLSGGDCR
ncbi:hypothetical protein [Paracoccus ravus]|uniref:hypothetical protein n=1 Tax=Paracoccus ravus TaxID=2447760 RepID=UPI00142F758F|nr:hypothetical protein [Paracoccus ravus]